MSDFWKRCEGQVVDGKFPLRRFLGWSDHSVAFLTERTAETVDADAGSRSSERRSLQSTETSEREGMTERRGRSAPHSGPQRAAIKFIPAKSANTETQLSNWKNAALISHPRLIRLFECGSCRLNDMDLLYVVMECADEDLSQILPERALKTNEVREMLAPVLEGLAYVHEQGLVHGHIKPANIMVVDDQLKISSDGLRRSSGHTGSRAEAGDAETAEGKEDIGVYDAPEIASGGATAAADIWSLGITLVETLTQSLPTREAETSAGVARGVVTPEAMPEPFRGIAWSCLRVEPEKRCTVAEIAAKLNPPAAVAVPTATATVSASSAPASVVPELPAARISAPSSVSAKPTSAEIGSVRASDTAWGAGSGHGVTTPYASDTRTVTLPPLPGMRRRDSFPLDGVNGRPMSAYLVPAIGVAFLLAAILIVPRFLSHQSDSEKAGQAVAQEAQHAATPARAANSRATSRSADAKSKVPERRNGGSAAAEQSAATRTPPSERSDRDVLQPTSDKEKIAAPKSDRDAKEQSGDADGGSAATTSPKISRAGEARANPAGMVTGEVLNRVLPESSQRARNTIRGTLRISVRVHVDETGAVKSAELDPSASSKYFGDLAVQAAQRWDFAPAKVNGHNVASEWRLRFEFTLTATQVFPTQINP